VTAYELRENRPRIGGIAFHRGRAGTLLYGGVALWIVVTALAGVWMAGAPFGPPFADPPPRNFAPPEMVTASAVVLSLCVVSGLLARLIRPAWAPIAVVMTAAVVVITVAAATQSVGAVLAATFICFIAWLSGLILLKLALGNFSNYLGTNIFSFALGIAVLGTAWLLLALAGRLETTTIVLLSLVIIAVAVVAHIRLSSSLFTLPPIRQTSNWTWFEIVAFSFLVGLVCLASLSAFVPETQSDATRQHLPIAREFWQAASVPIIDSMPVSMQSIQNHVIFAVAYGLGGMTASKLMQAAIGIACIVGVAELAGLAGGKSARLFGAAIFGSMPIVLWEIGHAYIDLLPVLMTVAAAMSIIAWLEGGKWPWLFTAGFLLGVGLASKLNGAIYIAAFSVGVVLVGHRSKSWRNRIFALASLASGCIVVTPWLMRMATAYGIGRGDLGISRLLRAYFPTRPTIDSLALLDTASNAESGVTNAGATPPFSSVVIQQFGHSLGDLLGMPWILTFQGKDLGFPIIGRGEIGVALLMLLPLVFFAPRTRTTAMLGILGIVSFIGWWASPYQIVRHLIPTLALVSALVAAGLAGLLASDARSRIDRLLRFAAQGGLLLSLVLVPFFFVPSSRAQMPIGYLVGAETGESFVNRTIRSAVALSASSALLVDDTPVVYVGGPWEAPQLYSEARLLTIPTKDLGPDAESVLATLERLGANHLIWNRVDSTDAERRVFGLSTPFLRHYTRILAGDDDAYLFEVLPAGDTIWGQPEVENLLEDPGLQDVKNKKGPWTAQGKSIIAKGVVALSRRATLTQEVAVTPGHAYLLEAPIRCLDPSGRGILTFRWFDAEGEVIDTESEEVRPGREISDQFLWRRAPEGAASVQAEFSMAGPSRCEYSGAALYDLG
jgi:4-amino-4-deoxy-L-arabinose transferase-like glycosyltransferase